MVQWPKRDAPCSIDDAMPASAFDDGTPHQCNVDQSQRRATASKTTCGVTIPFASHWITGVPIPFACHSPDHHIAELDAQGGGIMLESSCTVQNSTARHARSPRSLAWRPQRLEIELKTRYPSSFFSQPTHRRRTPHAFAPRRTGVIVPPPVAGVVSRKENDQHDCSCGVPGVALLRERGGHCSRARESSKNARLCHAHRIASRRLRRAAPARLTPGLWGQRIKRRRGGCGTVMAVSLVAYAPVTTTTHQQNVITSNVQGL